MDAIYDTQLAAGSVYLRQDVAIEPLVYRWYAWAHLISPIQLSLHLKYRLLPLLQSFVSNPNIHIAANSDPKMYGGPFVGVAISDVDRIRSLISSTMDSSIELLNMAEEIRNFDQLLQDGANGHSLNNFYSQLSARLAGLVELLYDTHHRPQMRFFEPLTYNFDNVNDGREIMLEIIDEKKRDFFMNTPRLENPKRHFFRMGFTDKRIDLLNSARTKALPFKRFVEEFSIPDDQCHRFRELFTDEPPALGADRDFHANGVRIRYFGHACILFQTRAVSILFDPFFSYAPSMDERLSFSDMPDVIDYVVVTHSHPDHFNPEMLMQLRDRIRCVVVPSNNSGNITDPSMKLILSQLGFDQVRALDAFDRINLPEGHITSLPFTGEHADLPIYGKQTISLVLQNHRMVLLVDSDGRDPVLYERLAERMGPTDLLFIGMECDGAPLNWLYEPLLGRPVSRRENESRRLSGADHARAYDIFSRLKPSKVFVYAMGQEPWMKYVMGLEYAPDSIQLSEANAFVDHCQQDGVAAERLYMSKDIII